jgi:excisionase family DNA binding protein
MQRLLKASEVAARTGLPVSTVYALAVRGEVPCIRLGDRAVRFPEETIEAWLKSRIRQPQPEPVA